jgi:hypothetical protein
MFKSKKVQNNKIELKMWRLKNIWTKKVRISKSSKFKNVHKKCSNFKSVRIKNVQIKKMFESEKVWISKSSKFKKVQI